MTMGARHKGGDRDTPMKKMVSRHGPSILQRLGGGAAAPGAQAAPSGAAAPCPPRLFQIVRDEVRSAAGGGQTPAFAALSLDAIRGDTDCRRLADDLPAAAKRARDGLSDGRNAAVLRAEIRDAVKDDVVSMMAGRALEGVMGGLLGGDQREQEMHLGALTVIVAGHLADVLLEDGADAPGKDRDSAGLIRALLLSAEPALFLAVKTAAALAKEGADYACRLGVAERDDPRIVLINTVAQAIEVAFGPHALRELESAGDPGRRERLAGRLAKSVCGEIARSLDGGRQAKIDGSEEGG